MQRIILLQISGLKTPHVLFLSLPLLREVVTRDGRLVITKLTSRLPY